MLDGVYAEHAAHSDDNDIIIIYDNMVASGADGNKCLPMCRDPCTANRNCHESNKFICRYSLDLICRDCHFNSKRKKQPFPADKEIFSLFFISFRAQLNDKHP